MSAACEPVEESVAGGGPGKDTCSYLKMPQTDTINKLGKHKAGVGCLYFNKLADVDVKVLEQLIKASVK